MSENLGFFRSNRQVADEKMRQLIRQNNVEIRELESHLRRAYINKEMSAQLRQRQHERMIQAELKAKEAREEARLCHRFCKEEEMEDLKLAQSRRRYHQLLSDQVTQKTRDSRQRSFEEFMEEKRRVDEIIETVKQEKREHLIKAMQKKQSERKDIEKFVQIQKEVAEQEKAIVERENLRIRTFLNEKQSWIREQEEVKKQRQMMKISMSEQLGMEIKRREDQYAQRNSLINELHEGRLLEAERQKERDEATQELRRRLFAKDCEEEALEMARQKQVRERMEEDQWRRDLMNQIAEEAKLDQMSNEKRRRKLIEHRKDIERLIEEKRVQKAKEKEQERKIWQEFCDYEEYMNKLIQEERIKILQTHADKLIGHLPIKVLSENDLEHLDENVRKSVRKQSCY